MDHLSVSDDTHAECHVDFEMPLNGIVGVIDSDGRRWTDAEVREALAKGARWRSAREAEGEVFPGPSE